MDHRVARLLMGIGAIAAGYVTYVAFSIVLPIVFLLWFERDVALKGNSSPAVLLSTTLAYNLAGTALCAIVWYFLFERFARRKDAG
jgi:membrane protein implicated in regulation of membrane protease activity